MKVLKGSTIYKQSIDYTVDTNTSMTKLVEKGSIAADSAVTVEYIKSTPH